MKTYVVTFIAISVVTLCCPWVQSTAQTIITYSDSLLNRPEDIVYDELRCCFYITSHDGDAIVKMDTAGRFSLILDSINAPMGIALCGDTLLIASNLPATITAVDVNNFHVLYRVNVPEALYLNQIETDARTGHAYIVEQRGMLVKFNYRSPAYSIFVRLGGGLDLDSQSAELDPSTNRLYIFKFSSGYVKGVSIHDSTQITNVAPQVIAQITASTSGASGEFYVSTWWGSSIYKYSSNLSGQPVIISSGHSQPTGLVYRSDNHSLYICNYGNSTIDQLILPATDVNGQSRHLEFHLAQNFPNPFNPTTTIDFQIPARAFVTLKVFDILGRQIATLLNEQKEPGMYHTSWDASGYASGVFVCRLEADGYIATRRMLLVR